MKESEMYRTMNAHLGKKMFLRRVECQGFPDLFYRSNDHEGWIEFKIGKRKGNKIEIPFRPGQLSWIEDYRKRNGDIWLFVFLENGLWVFRRYSINPLYTEEDFIALTHYKGYWQNIRWSSIYLILHQD
jgi:hypothetical protein